MVVKVVEDVEFLLDYWSAVIRDLSVKVGSAQELATDDLRAEYQDLVDAAIAAKEAAEADKENHEEETKTIVSP
jgi:hypothetical protein